MMSPSDKELVKEIASGGQKAFSYIQRLLNLGEEQSKLAAAAKDQTAKIEAQAAEIAQLRQDIAVLRAREDVLLARAAEESARVSAQIVSDLARRIGLLESVLAILGGTD